MTSIKYMTSLLTFYLKGEIRTEKNFIQFKTPNTILGLIPLGAKTEKFTIDQISSTTTNFRLRLKYLIFGMAVLLAVKRKRGYKTFYGHAQLFISPKCEDSPHQSCLQPFPYVLVNAIVDVTW